MTMVKDRKEIYSEITVKFDILDYKTMANKLASLVQVDIDRLNVTKTSWGQQFRDAMNVNGGDLETAKFSHYFGHTLAFFWKVTSLGADSGFYLTFR